MTWTDAWDYCKFNGKSLISIESALKAAEIKLYMYPYVLGVGK